MNEIKNGLILDFDKVFGTLEFMSVGDEVRERNQYSNRQEVVGHVYHVSGEKVPRGVEVQVLNRRAKTFVPFTEVQFVAPVVFPQMERGQNFSRTGYLIKARDIIPKTDA